MAFQEITHTAGRGPSPIQSVRVSISKHGNAILRLPRNIADPLGFVSGGRATISVGTGADAGKIAIRASQDGYAVCGGHKSAGAALQITIAAKTVGWSNAQHGVLTASHEIVDGMLVVEVPASISGYPSMKVAGVAA